jgi:hypothetical protein
MTSEEGPRSSMVLPRANTVSEGTTIQPVPIDLGPCGGKDSIHRHDPSGAADGMFWFNRKRSLGRIAASTRQGDPR